MNQAKAIPRHDAARPEVQVVPSVADVERLAREKFGFAALRPGQAEMVQALLTRQSFVAVYPTGYGKSAAYQLASQYARSTIIVVAPTVELIHDQIQFLKQHGIWNVRAHYIAIPEGKSQHRRNVLPGPGAGKLDRLSDKLRERVPPQLLFIYAERLMDEGVIDVLAEAVSEGLVSAVVVDEAHAISEWSHDFRIAYRLLGQVAQRGATIAGLTATAAPHVLEDIRATLKIAASSFFRGVTPDRPEIFLEAETTTSLPSDRRPNDVALTRHPAWLGSNPSIAWFVAPSSWPTHVEDRHRRTKPTEHRASIGTANRVDYDTPETLWSQAHREVLVRQDAFVAGLTRTLVASEEFGVGINKVDLRMVVHVQLPRSLQGYYQEIGRAGRDGKSALARLVTHAPTGACLQALESENVPRCVTEGRCPFGLKGLCDYGVRAVEIREQTSRLAHFADLPSRFADTSKEFRVGLGEGEDLYLISHVLFAMEVVGCLSSFGAPPDRSGDLEGDASRRSLAQGSVLVRTHPILSRSDIEARIRDWLLRSGFGASLAGATAQEAVARLAERPASWKEVLPVALPPILARRAQLLERSQLNMLRNLLEFTRDQRTCLRLRLAVMFRPDVALVEGFRCGYCSVCTSAAAPELHRARALPGLRSMVEVLTGLDGFASDGTVEAVAPLVAELRDGGAAPTALLKVQRLLEMNPDFVPGLHLAISLVHATGHPVSGAGVWVGNLVRALREKPTSTADLRLLLVPASSVHAEAFLTYVLEEGRLLGDAEIGTTWAVAKERLPNQSVKRTIEAAAAITVLRTQVAPAALEIATTIAALKRKLK